MGNLAVGFAQAQVEVVGLGRGVEAGLELVLHAARADAEVAGDFCDRERCVEGGFHQGLSFGGQGVMSQIGGGASLGQGRLRGVVDEDGGNAAREGGAVPFGEEVEHHIKGGACAATGAAPSAGDVARVDDVDLGEAG